jgi:hypothetical protein
MQADKKDSKLFISWGLPHEIGSVGYAKNEQLLSHRVHPIGVLL